MIDDLAMAEIGETADDQARICRPQPLDGLFHVPFFFSVPTGDLCIGLYQKVRSIEIKSCLPSGPDGFQADMTLPEGVGKKAGGTAKLSADGKTIFYHLPLHKEFWWKDNDKPS